MNKVSKLLIAAIPLTLAGFGIHSAVTSWPREGAATAARTVVASDGKPLTVETKVNRSAVEDQVKDNVKGKLAEIAVTLEEIKKEKPVCAVMLNNYIGVALDSLTMPPPKRGPFEERKEEFALNYLDYGCSLGGIIWAGVEVREIERGIVETIKKAQRAQN
jgi:hypothetical protein